MLGLGFKKISDVEWTFPNSNVRVLDTQVEMILDIPTEFSTDYLVVLSPHKSKEGKPMLTAHFPGNWSSANFGGKPHTLNIAYGKKIADIIKGICTHAKTKNLDFEVVLEVDHHGPTCNVPIIFVEIGSTEMEWGNKRAAEVIANAIFNTVNNNETQDAKLKTIFGIGGGHYAREFTEMILNNDRIVGHILPKYKLDALTEDTFKQAIEKNIEKISEVVVLKESLNAIQKKKVKELCEKFGVEYVEHEVE